MVVIYKIFVTVTGQFTELSILCWYACMYNFKVIGMNEKNQMCLTHKEWIGDYRCERIDMTGKLKYLWLSLNISEAFVETNVATKQKKNIFNGSQDVYSYWK